MFDKSYIIKTQETEVGRIPVIDTSLNLKDRMGSLLMRLDIGRKGYTIKPGLYMAGKPDKTSPVLVTANYKLTFDTLRKELGGLNVWIIVLDTKGINVWCAAGKGTFGTEELIQRIFMTGILDVIEHKNIIIPQLGAPGISAHKVENVTGAKLIYGPVRAEDLTVFIENGYKADDRMREVRFDMRDRLVLTPVEFVQTLPYLLIFAALLLTLKYFDVIDLVRYILPLSGAVFIGTVLTPLLLPYLPFKAFSAKGAVAGGIWAVLYVFFSRNPADLQETIVLLLTYILLLSPISAFLALNFTGASTYTSPSGVKSEIKAGVPVMIMSAFAGLVLLVLEIINII